MITNLSVIDDFLDGIGYAAAKITVSGDTLKIEAIENSDKSMVYFLRLLVREKGEMTMCEMLDEAIRLEKGAE